MSETTHQFTAILWLKDGSHLSIGPYPTIKEARQAKWAKKDELRQELKSQKLTWGKK